MKVIPLKASPYAYWRSVQESKAPFADAAAREAAYHLTPPPSSGDVERLFSTAGHIYSDDRNRLKPENLEKLLFLRENLKYLDFQY